jgi:hypothetical protein
VPDVRNAALDNAVRAVAAFGFEGREDPDQVVVHGDGEWRAFAAKVWAEKLTGLAVEAVRAGTLPLNRERSDALLERHRRAMAWCLRIEERLLDLDERLVRSGIGYAVLKGPAVAHTAYADQSWRGFGDLDVLVRGRDFKDACLVLRQMGFRRRMREPRPGFDERFGKAAAHRSEDDSMEIDLHRTLVLGPFGLWIDPEELLDRSVPFELGGRKVPRLDDTGTLLNVAMHAALGWPPALLPFRDVLEVSGSLEVDWEVLARWARDWRVAAVLRYAFATAESTLGGTAAAESRVFAGMRPPKGEERALVAYLEEGRGVGGTAVSTLRAIPGLRGKAAYVSALAFPRRDFMQDRYRFGPNTSYGHRLMTPARWAMRRIART